jgi:hypothetical protein
MPSTVKKGSTGSDVTLCQERLVLWGYPCTVDGIFGAGTESQAIAFQSAHGLVADGIVGDATWNVLLSTPGADMGEPSYQDLDVLSRSMLIEISWYIGWDYTDYSRPGSLALVAQPSRLAPSNVVWAKGKKTDTVCCVFVAGVLGRVYDKTAKWTSNAWSRFMVPASEPWGMVNECVAAGIGVAYTGVPKADKWYVVQGWNDLVNGQYVDGKSKGHQWLQWGPDLMAEATTWTDEDANGASDDVGAVAWRHRTWDATRQRYQEVRLVELVAA